MIKIHRKFFFIELIFKKIQSFEVDPLPKKLKKSKKSKKMLPICISFPVNPLFQDYFGKELTSSGFLKKLLPTVPITYLPLCSSQPLLIDTDSEIGKIIIKALSLFGGNIDDLTLNKNLYEYYRALENCKTISIIPIMSMSLFKNRICENPLLIEKRWNRRKNFIYMVKHILSLKENKPLLLKLCCVDLVVYIIAKYI